VEPQLARRDCAESDMRPLGAADGVRRLPEGWLVGRDCTIRGAKGKAACAEMAVLHPALGIALLGPEGWADGIDDVLRRRLDETRFATVFKGHLPILYGTVGELDAGELGRILVQAFRTQPSLDLSGGDEWVSAVTRLVVPADRRWTDNLDGLPPVPRLRRGWTERVSWRSDLAEVVPLMQADARPTEGADTVPAAPRRWHWAASAAALAACAAIVWVALASVDGEGTVQAPALTHEAAADASKPSPAVNAVTGTADAVAGGTVEAVPAEFSPPVLAELGGPLAIAAAAAAVPLVARADAASRQSSQGKEQQRAHMQRARRGPEPRAARQEMARATRARN
jgi:hypothetical protein